MQCQCRGFLIYLVLDTENGSELFISNSVCIRLRHLTFRSRERETNPFPVGNSEGTLLPCYRNSAHDFRISFRFSQIKDAFNTSALTPWKCILAHSLLFHRAVFLCSDDINAGSSVITERSHRPELTDPLLFTLREERRGEHCTPDLTLLDQRLNAAQSWGAASWTFWPSEHPLHHF